MQHPSEAFSGLEAVRRLFQRARADTHQAAHVRRFLLAWWNAEEWGGFNPTILWLVDRAIAEDMLAALRFIAHAQLYPDAFGFIEDIEAIITLEEEAPT